MKVLIIGGGGREHALAWKVAQSLDVTQVYVAPGNAGTAIEKRIKNISINAEDIDELLQFAQSNDIDLTIVGPEVPLVKGVVDIFTAAGLRCFGPSAKSAQLEGSKAYSKDFLARHNIPTAKYQTFTDPVLAEEYIKVEGAPIVVKADGLAAGKGVVVAQSEAEAIDAVKDMLEGNAFGDAGSRVVIEEFLEGEEASFIVMADGKNVLPFATSQDHKARDNGDIGPNTGGMGAYSPAPVVTDDVYKKTMDLVISPTIEGMIKDGTPYTGFLYAGLMINKDGGIKVLEFNCRFGDPETQPIMMRLQSDLVDLCNAAIDKELDTKEIKFDNRPCVGVVLAAGGYPASYCKGDVIEGLPQDELSDAKVFHAGTANKDGAIVTNGGRVLCVCALGDNVTAAQENVYKLVDQVSWNNVYFRTDIGYRAVNREK